MVVGGFLLALFAGFVAWEVIDSQLADPTEDLFSRLVPPR